MKRSSVRLVMLFWAAMIAWSPSAVAQEEQQIQQDVYGREVFRFGQNFTVRQGTTVRQVAVVFGDATIEGHVDGDVAVIFGRAQFASTAVVDGKVVVVGGTISVREGASIHDDLVAVGAGFDAPASFSPGGEFIVIGPGLLGAHLDAVVPWFTRGLLWGRLIVPDLGWVWQIAAMFFFVSLVLNLIFDRPVRASAATLGEKPLTAFAVGLLVLLLMGPVCLLLVVSVIGIAVVPFVICAMIAAALIGRVGTVRWIGTGLIPQREPEDRVQSLRSFLLGSALVAFAYMIPVIGLFTWAMLGVFGLGAATLAFVGAYRREHPPAEVKPVPVVVAAPPAAYSGDTGLPNHEPPLAAVAVPPVAVPAVSGDALSLPRAAFRDRLFAVVLDVILVVFVQQLLDLNRRDSAIFLLLLAYHIGFWTWKSTTVGGIICQLRIVRADGTPLRFVDALVRGLSGIFSAAVAGIGFLWILRDPERQAWHDKIAGTYVVNVPRNWPL